jgi:hypothetical protein
MRQFEEFEQHEDMASFDMHINLNAPQFSRPRATWAVTASCPHALHLHEAHN